MHNATILVSDDEDHITSPQIQKPELTRPQVDKVIAGYKAEIMEARNTKNALSKDQKEMKDQELFIKNLSQRVRRLEIEYKIPNSTERKEGLGTDMRKLSLSINAKYKAAEKLVARKTALADDLERAEEAIRQYKDVGERPNPLVLLNAHLQKIRVKIQRIQDKENKKSLTLTVPTITDINTSEQRPAKPTKPKSAMLKKIIAKRKWPKAGDAARRKQKAKADVVARMHEAAREAMAPAKRTWPKEGDAARKKQRVEADATTSMHGAAERAIAPPPPFVLDAASICAK